VTTFAHDLSKARLVPVIRHPEHDIARAACEMLLEEGVGALEITMSVPGATDLIAELVARFPLATIGAGTVLTEMEAHNALEAGSDFIVSPCWSDEVAQIVHNASMPYLPGAMTPGEVLHHWNGGAALVKVFPAEAAGGPSFIKALRSVFPAIPLMPTGGVSPANTQLYLDAGATCVGMGGQLLPAHALERGDVVGARAQILAAIQADHPQPL